MELILDQIGTPSVEEIYKSGRYTNRSKVFQKGKIEPKLLKEAFEREMSDYSINFIQECLQFDPDKRMTVDEALQHEFLKDMRNPSEEIASDKISRYDFVFEDEEIENLIQLRQLILEEIMLYHDVNFYNKYISDKKNYNEFFEKVKNISHASSFSNEIAKDKLRKQSILN